MIFILERIEKIEKICAPSVAAALENEIIHMAVERLLETIADATKYIPANQKAKYPDIEWSAIIGFRNILAHDYMGISVRAIKDIIEDELPGLKAAIVNIMKDLDANG